MGSAISTHAGGVVSVEAVRRDVVGGDSVGLDGCWGNVGVRDERAEVNSWHAVSTVGSRFHLSCAT